MTLKIAVYTIALNEEKHVSRWFNSAKAADLLVIADTGSKDKTVALARSLGISVYDIEVNPWRFDVARNASLALVPSDFDVCIQLDMDEVLPADWRAKVEDAWLSGNTWPIYKHVTSRYPNGQPRSYLNYFKIHPRKGFVWRYPIHEVLVPLDGTVYKRETIDLEVDHLKDHSKDRGSYLTLLENGTVEFPTDWRMNHYLTREYWYQGRWNDVLANGLKALSLQIGTNYEVASTAMWTSEAAFKLGDVDLSRKLAERATGDCPDFYEAWHWRAHMAHLRKDWKECFDSAIRIELLTRQDHHLVKPEVWEWWGYDLVALSAHYLGKHELAVFYGRRALAANPTNQRLNSNLGFYNKGYQQSFGHLATFNSTISKESIFEVTVINLDRRKDRLERISQKLNVDFRVHKSFDGLNLKNLAEKGFLTSQQQSILEGIVSFPVNKPEVVSAIFAKWVSHVSVWTTIANSGRVDVTHLIVEDDIVPIVDFQMFFATMDGAIYQLNSMIFVGRESSPEEIVPPSQEVGVSNKVIDLKGLSEVTEAGYIINLPTAIELLEQLANHLDKGEPLPPLRQWLFELSSKIPMSRLGQPLLIQNSHSHDSDVGAEVR